MAAHALTSSFLLSSLLFAATPIYAQSNVTVNPHIAGIPSIPEVTECTDVHVFLAKGNNETEAGQRQLKLVDAICKTSPSNTTCGHESIHFDNRYETVFCVSLEEGAPNGQKQLIDYNQKCPESKIVVAGYSQGAHVVGDVLGGGGGTFFQDCVQKPNAGLDPASKEHTLGKQIVAVSLCGNTRHTASQEYNTLSGSGANGLFPRKGDLLKGLNKWTNVLQDYCAETDPICAEDSGADVVAETHLDYFDVYASQIAGWVWKKIENSAESNATSSATSTSSATKTSSTGSSTASSTANGEDEGTADATSTATIPTGTSDSEDAAASETGSAASGADGVLVSLGMLVLPLVAISGLL